MLKTKYLLPLILILLLTFISIGNCDWLPGWDQRIELSIDDYAGDIGAEVVWWPATVFLTATQCEEVFVELTTDAEYLKTAVTKADGITRLYADFELFDVSEEKGIFHTSRDGWTINSNDKIYLYYDKDHNFLFDDADYENILEDSPSSAYGEPTVITDATQIDLWFYGGASKPLYYSTSTDGINWSEPVTTDLPDNYKRPHILKVGSTYYLYVVDADDENIYLYTGTNKTNFVSQGIVLTRTAETWDSLNIANTFVWIENVNDWYMLYEGIGTGQAQWAIGLATSSDGETWTKEETNPVFSVIVDGSGCGNPELARVGSTVIKYDSKYYMYYHAGAMSTVGGNIFRAYSTNLTSWTDEGQISGIVVDPSAWSHGDQCLAEFKGKTYLWWTPSNQVNTSYLNQVVDNRSYGQIISLSVDNWIGKTGTFPAEQVWNDDYRGVYHMIDITTSTIKDSTVNRNHGTKTDVNEPMEAIGKVGLGQDFDGGDDYINITNDASLRPQYITISACIKHTAEGYREIFQSYYQLDKVAGIEFRQDADEKLQLVSGDNTGMIFGTDYQSISSDSVINTGAWVHVAGVYDGSELIVYVNGVDDGSVVWTNDPGYNVANNRINIGVNNYVGTTYINWFDGIIDELRVSAVARSAAWEKGEKNSLWDDLFTYGSEESIPVVTNVMFIFGDF